LTRSPAAQQTAPYGPGQAYPQPGYGYPTQPTAPPRVGPMTIDDVVIRAVGLLGIVGAVAAVSWLFLPPAAYSVALFGSMIAGLILVLVITFARITNPIAIVGYAVVEGVFVGVISKLYESTFSGIVMQAAVGTLAVFLGMAAVYKSKVIRVTSGFTKVMSGIGFGILGLFLVDWLLYLFGGGADLLGNPFDGKVSMLPILLTLAIIVWGALTFLIDFKVVEEGVRMGAPRQFAWYAAFGIVVGLVFMYLQLLRLIGLIRE
jgi:uncharacterized YccA/Bax inhibitor family protein